MEIYLVRHGETGGNVAHRHQAEDTPLTLHGAAQAAKVAETIKNVAPTHLLSSRLVRALETARIIGDACDLVPETSEHFIELARPSALYGHHHASPRSFAFYAQWYLGVGTGSRAGESYAAFRERITTAKQQLHQYNDDARVVVVSHTVFINFMLAHLCREHRLSPIGAALTFRQLLTMPNGAVVKLHLHKTSSEQHCPWSVEKWLETS